MKHNYRFLLMVLVAGIIFWPAKQASAQGDTLAIEWYDPVNQEVIMDALTSAIAGDTDRPEGRVYKLKKGGYYWITSRIENDGYHLRIVGETPGETLQEAPAVIMMHEDDQGVVDGRIITGKASVTLKNLWLTGNDNAGTQTYYQPIQMDASDSRFVIENCILTRTNFALIAWTGTNNDIFYRNNVFRNKIGKPSSQQWEGRGMSIWADQDTVIVENNTFFMIHSFPFQLEGGAGNYVRINHNTFVNVGRQMVQGGWWREMYFANNLIYNGFWHGEGYQDYSDENRDPDAYTTGMFPIGELPSKYGPPLARRILLANCSAYRDPVFDAFYADTIRAQPLVNGLANREHIGAFTTQVAVDTIWADPQLATTFEASVYDSMIQNIDDLRHGITPATDYHWQLPETPVQINWPLPEDFSYSNATLLTAGTDDLPLGDLNWFPTQKADWEANKAQHIKNIEDMAGPRIQLEVAETAEAEKGTLSGNATAKSAPGFTYFQMDGGGFIQWDFDVPTEGQYDLNIWTHMRNNSIRGQRVIVNGVSIHDPRGWGEYIWDTDSGPHAGMPINEWTWTRIIQDSILEAGALTFPAGANTIRIEQSWGWQHFAGFDLLEPGTDNVVVSIRATDVSDYSIVAPISSLPYTPSYFWWVDLDGAASITWDVNVESDGLYRVNLFCQAPWGPQVVEIQVDGATVVPSLSIEGTAGDSSLVIVLSDNFNVTAGAHTLSLVSSTAQLMVDFVQLIEEVTFIGSGGDNLLEGFSLAQNYPNPFNPETNINFTLGKASHVKLTIYNVLGQKVATLVDNRMIAGSHTVKFRAGSLASGIYFYRLEAGDFKSHKKMVFIR